MRIATFTFRSIPQRPGCAGVDKVSLELYTRLAARGHEIVAYNRLFPGEEPIGETYKGITTKNFYTTTRRKGFDSIVHSFKVCRDIIKSKQADVVHIHNTGNSPFGLLLRLFGKKVVLSQDGVDWQRGKWPWYGRAYLWLTVFITAFAPHRIVFDTTFYKEVFEKRFRRTYNYISWGAEVPQDPDDSEIFGKVGVEPGEYFLFVGRFIPEKGLHHLVAAFEKLESGKKLLLVGGPPNPAEYEKKLLATADTRIVFPGFIFGQELFTLMRNAYTYVQPSLIEGLSPVVLENMGLGVPMITSNIPENSFAVGGTSVEFKAGDIDDLADKLRFALDNPEKMRGYGQAARDRAQQFFSWDRCADNYEQLFRDLLDSSKGDRR